MGLLIELAGARGVGKSTTLDILEKMYPGIKRNEGFIKNHMPANTPEEFIKKQKTYISDCICLINSLKKNNAITFITRGAEEIIIYTKTFLKINHPDWNVLDELKDDLAKLTECFADKVFYFDCPVDELKRRWASDSKVRKDFSFWMAYNDVSLDFYKNNIQNCVFIDAKNISPNERADILSNFLEEVA